jgi:hypothetical protein
MPLLAVPTWRARSAGLDVGGRRRYFPRMMTLTVRGRIRGGRIVVDEPLELPEDLEVDVAVQDAGDDLDAEERGRLHAAIERGAQQVERDEVVPAEQVLVELLADSEE